MIKASMKYSEEKIKKLVEYLTAMIASIMYQIKISKSSLDKKDSPKAQDTTTLVPANNKDLPLRINIRIQTGLSHKCQC